MTAYTVRRDPRPAGASDLDAIWHGADPLEVSLMWARMMSVKQPTNILVIDPNGTKHAYRVELNGAEYRALKRIR